MWLSPVMFHYGLCHMNIQEVPRVLPNSLKGWGVCYHAYVIGAHKRTHVDHWNMPNHCTSIYHEWMCVWVAALKVIVTRYTAQSVMWTCMLPRELIWERVAPSYWCDTEQWLALAAVIVKRTWKGLQTLRVARYTNHLLYYILYYGKLNMFFRNCFLNGAVSPTRNKSKRGIFQIFFKRFACMQQDRLTFD